MGTTTFYLKHNDFGNKLNSMTKEELEKLSKLSPYSKEQSFSGWTVPFELHNGNVYVLVFWKGRLMKLEGAPNNLNKKYWNSYEGKTMNIYEWTLLKRRMLNNIEYLDKEFKKNLKKMQAKE